MEKDKKIKATKLGIIGILCSFLGAFATNVSAGVTWVTICHQPDTSAEGVMRVPEQAVDAHLDHGDFIDLDADCQLAPDPKAR